MYVTTYIFIGLFACLFFFCGFWASKPWSPWFWGKCSMNGAIFLGPSLTLWSNSHGAVYNWGDRDLKSFDDHLRVWLFKYRPPRCFQLSRIKPNKNGEDSNAQVSFSFSFLSLFIIFHLFYILTTISPPISLSIPFPISHLPPHSLPPSSLFPLQKMPGLLW